MINGLQSLQSNRHERKLQQYRYFRLMLATLVGRPLSQRPFLYPDHRGSPRDALARTPCAHPTTTPSSCIDTVSPPSVRTYDTCRSRTLSYPRPWSSSCCPAAQGPPKSESDIRWHPATVLQKATVFQGFPSAYRHRHRHDTHLLSQPGSQYVGPYLLRHVKVSQSLSQTLPSHPVCLKLAAGQLRTGMGHPLQRTNQSIGKQQPQTRGQRYAWLGWLDSFRRVFLACEPLSVVCGPWGLTTITHPSTHPEGRYSR